jgi:hypothetical protein
MVEVGRACGVQAIEAGSQKGLPGYHAVDVEYPANSIEDEL